MLCLPEFNLDAPGTFLFGGVASSGGLRFNRFALSLKRPECRRRFLADEHAFVAAADLSPSERRLVAERDWTGMLRAGAHLQAILKLAATLGFNIFHVGAHNIGTDLDSLHAACPRRISSLGTLDG